MSGDLVEWLTARYDDEEMRAAGASAGPWTWYGLGDRGYPQRITNGAAIVVAETFTNPDFPAYEAEFIAWNDPARRLDEIAANRRILHEHREHPMAPEGFCATCGGTQGPCMTKRLLALPYANCPGYREEWRP